jgi:hypothetical protein
MFDGKTRDEIETHLLVVRAKRMAAVVTYYAGVNAKNLHLVAKEQQRVAREYALLAKDIDKMNKLEMAIEARLTKLEQHQQELEFHRGNLVEIEDGDREQKSNGEYKRKDRKQTGTATRGTAVRSGRPPGA